MINKKAQFVHLSQFKLNPDNPRTIGKERLRSLVESIKRDPEFLGKRGIVHADGVILGGNQRYLAIKEALDDDAFRQSLSLEIGTIPAAWVQDASDWPEEKRRRFVIVDNGSWGEWDLETLRKFDDLPLADFGIHIPEILISAIPDNNKPIDEELMKDTKNECPTCGFKW